MKHKVCINIAKPGGTPTPVVRSGTVQIRKRLIDFLFPKHINPAGGGAATVCPH